MIVHLASISMIGEWLRSSFRFLASVMSLCATATAILLILLDCVEASHLAWIARWTYAFSPESARAILSAIAGSMITVAGLTFSMRMLTLQLASSQFGPRMLRDFMRDRSNQIVLGTFLSTFFYCPLVLAAVRGTAGSSFVPLIAVSFGMILAVERRIVEIAQRALSPGINDPTTALYCLDRLGEVSGLLVDRHLPSGRMNDQDMKPRVVFDPVNFAELACSAFAAIGRYGIRDGDLVARLLHVMEHSSRGALDTDRETIVQLRDAIEAGTLGSPDFKLRDRL